jgi:hypothetical protein
MTAIKLAKILIKNPRFGGVFYERAESLLLAENRPSGWAYLRRLNDRFR